MEGLTRLVSESLARHGFDRPLDYRRLRWSRWFRCESAHSLLFVPSKPGVFALAEEIMDLGSGPVGTPENSPAFQRREEVSNGEPRPSRTLETDPEPCRMLAVSQFFDADDMAFTLDRMVTRNNPMRSRLASGRYFIRFVVIEDHSQRLSIAAALNQWIVNSAEKVSAIGAHFATSLEITDAHVDSNGLVTPATSPQLDSGAASNLHCPSPLPSGF
jgi:hypothetical protein